MTWIGGISVGGVLLAVGFVKCGDFFQAMTSRVP